MNIESIREYCLRLPGVTEGFPFGEEVLVFKVAGKMFLLLPLKESPVQFNAKCDPDKAIELRAEYAFIEPGYHMNKKHWNTVICDESEKDAFFFSLIKDSYDLVKKSLPLKERKLLEV
jgi:predicted DNA-binding protein (MmcQ/YjbR family)